MKPEDMLLCCRCGRRFDENHIGHVDDHMEMCDDCHEECQEKELCTEQTA